MGLITACVLLFRNYPYPQRRCLQSLHAMIARSPGIFSSVRIGMNEVPPQAPVRDEVTRLSRAVPVVLYDSPVNRAKYPVMRRMFYDTQNPITTDYVLWFDDDSYVTTVQPRPEQALAAALRGDPCFVGRKYQIRLTPHQCEMVMRQPWYAPNRIAFPVVTFNTGGLWAGPMAFLRRWDYPWPELYHNGGDVMLGAMIAAQACPSKRLPVGFHVNADESGADSTAKRRGLSTPPLWSSPTVVHDLLHQNFELKGTRLPRCEP